MTRRKGGFDRYYKHGGRTPEVTKQSPLRCDDGCLFLENDIGQFYTIRCPLGRGAFPEPPVVTLLGFSVRIQSGEETGLKETSLAGILLALPHTVVLSRIPFGRTSFTLDPV